MQVLQGKKPRSSEQLAGVIVARVLQKLEDLGHVPPTLSLGDRPAVWTLSRTTDVMIGRAAEVNMVVASLRQHGAALIWGGPGEGKSTLAMAAAALLRVDQPNLHAFRLDMRGEPTSRSLGLRMPCFARHACSHAPARLSRNSLLQVGKLCGRQCATYLSHTVSLHRRCCRRAW